MTSGSSATSETPVGAAGLARELPKGWSAARIGEIAGDVTSGATPTSGSARYYADGAPYLFAKIEDLTSAPGRFLTSTTMRVTEAALRETALQVYPVGTLLLSMYGTVGLVKTVAVPLTANQALAALLPPFRCDPAYLFHFLVWKRKAWDALKAQTTQANINGAKVKAFEIQLPSRPEQRAIAHVLTTLDDLIADTEAAIAKLEAIRQGLLHDLLTRGLDENGEVRPAGVPRNSRRVDSVFDMQLGKMLSKDASSGPNQKEYLANRHVQWGRVDLENLDTMSFNPEEQLKYSIVPGDLLVCEGGEVGRTALWAGERDDVYIQKAVHRLRTRGDVLPAYMLWFMRHAAKQKLFADLMSQTSIAHLTKEKLGQLLVPCPPPDEQAAIARVLNAADSQVTSETALLQRLSDLKEAVQSDLLMGRTRVTPELLGLPPEDGDV